MGLTPLFLSAAFIAFLTVRQLRNLVFPLALVRRLGTTSSALGFFFRHAASTAPRLGTMGTSRSLRAWERRDRRSGFGSTWMFPLSRSTAFHSSGVAASRRRSAGAESA